MALIKLVKTKPNEGKQIIVVRFECVFCGASGVNRRHCAAGEADVAAEGWAVPALRDSVPYRDQNQATGPFFIKCCLNPAPEHLVLQGFQTITEAEWDFRSRPEL